MSSDDKNHWKPAYIGLGSNLDGPARQLELAFDLLGEITATRIVQRSSLYRSVPFGGVEQPDFVNAAASILTQLTAQELLLELQRIETERGRDRGEVRWGPRVLDLDLLVYADQTIDEPGLCVPHPGIGERNFVLLPLGEIEPELSIPGLGRLADLDADSIEPQISRIGISRIG
jgi:2-amino-4-hydroxy-6-hydroxymethyldihydropteridine diphosphokinase